MKKRGIYIVLQNKKLTRDVYEMILAGDTQWITRPGQFVNIELAGKYLRRPISLCDWDTGTITLIYKVVGEGTEQMSRLQNYEKLDLLTGLGNGFDTSAGFTKAVVAGGGVGIPPLYRLTKELLKTGKEVAVALGFNTATEAFYVQKFKALGCAVFVSTADGSIGTKGYVTDAIKESNTAYDYFFTCGPKAMLKAVSELCACEGQLSFEERMGCGFGACMGCTCRTKYGNKRICVDGPVLLNSEVIW
jgi:dihydroorotate dehydrogenase electron transfer subunit